MRVDKEFTYQQWFYTSVAGDQKDLLLFERLDAFAEANYGTYIGYNLINVEDITLSYGWVARYKFNNEYDSKRFEEYAQERRKSEESCHLDTRT